MPAVQTRNAREFILYRWWDASGRLLYVGKSVSLFNRVSQHRRGSAFFAEAETMTMQRLETAEQLAASEKVAIRTESPVYNIMDRRPTQHSQTRRTIVAELDPSSSGHWAPIDYDDIQYGDIVRWTYKQTPSEVVEQGIVDDDGQGDEGEHEWYLYTAEAEKIVLDEFMAGLCLIRRWEHVSGDPTAEAYKNAAAIGLTAGADL